MYLHKHSIGVLEESTNQVHVMWKEGLVESHLVRCRTNNQQRPKMRLKPEPMWLPKHS